MNARYLIILLSVITGTSLLAEVQVRARFEPSRVAIGNTSRYVIEVTTTNTNSQPGNQRITELPVPPVGGLTLRNIQTSSEQHVSLINGQATYSITQKLTVDAIPQRTGSFTIPAYTLEYGNESIRVPAATLSVVERSANTTSTTDELVFLSLDTPQQLYVGQTTQLELKLFVAEGIDLRGLSAIEKTAEGFTLSGGPSNQDPTKSAEIANNRRYSVFTWPLEITPIRSGKQELNFYLELSIVLPRQRSRSNSPFGSILFGDFFGRAERIGAYTKPTEIDVLPLPTEGKPESFSGAIGQFNIEISADAESTRVSEPIMLSLKASGEGNFDRIHGPELPQADGWRSYPPETIFEKNESQPLKGAKRFDYIFVPEKAGTLELPKVNFSFFDPKAERYIELTGPTLSVEVAPATQSAIPIPNLNDATPAKKKQSTQRKHRRKNSALKNCWQHSTTSQRKLETSVKTVYRFRC